MVSWNKNFSTQNDKILIYNFIILLDLVMTPHLGTATVRTTNDMAIIAALNVLTGMSGEAMYSPVV